MKLLTRFGLPVLLGTLVVLAIQQSLNSPVETMGHPSPAGEELASRLDEASANVNDQSLTHEADRIESQQTAEVAHHLAELEQDKAKRERAVAGMTASRRELQLSTLGSWAALVRSNMATFHELNLKARQSPNRQVACTICDSHSYMPCIMCPNGSGKCPTCHGTGRLHQDDYCPSCLGTGKCYLCSGSGKMFCPFCDDGMIKLNWPMPPYFPPGG